MDSRQLIRTTRKVLATIEALNQHQALRVAEMARILGLPRTTTFRLLETLRDLRYIARRDEDLRYHLTSRILALSAGFQQPLVIAEVARPILDRLCVEVRWPVSLASLHGAAMRVLYTTDALTPHKSFTSTAGIDMPLRSTASGLVHLAFSDPTVRDSLLESMPSDEPDNSSSDGPQALLKLLGVVREQGYHFVDRSYLERANLKGTKSKECIAAVPVLIAGKPEPLAALSSRMMTEAVSRDWIVRVLVPRLGETAAEIAQAYAAAARPQQH